MRKPSLRYFASVGKGEPEEIEVAALDEHRLRLTLRGRTVDVDVRELPQGGASLLVGEESFDVRIEDGPERPTVFVRDQAFAVDVADERWMRLRAAGLRPAAQGKQTVSAPMPGKVVRVLVKPGDEVKEGQGLIVVEAMKMENELRSPKAGKIVEVAVAEGKTVEGGAKLVVVE